MPSPPLRLSRKLGGIPQGEASSPAIYRKPQSYKMRPIPLPPERKRVRKKKQSRTALYLGVFLVTAVLLGGGAYWYFIGASQILAFIQRAKATPAPMAVKGGYTPADTTPLAEPAQGWVWLFDEGEWRVQTTAQHEYKEGLLRLRSKMEKPQPGADASIRARIVVREGGGNVGIFLRSTAERGRYRLSIDPDLRYVRLVHEGPKGTDELGKHRFFKSLMKGDRLTLELRADGERISGSVNGERVIDAEDPRSKEAGTWGIESGDGWFELVEVPIPPPKVVAEAAPPAPVEPAAPMATPPPKPEPAPMPAAPQSETAKWMAGLEPQWQEAYEREVVAPYEKSVADLKKQFLTTVEAQLAAATQAKRMDDTAFFRGERQRLAAGEDVPMTDEAIVPPSLKNLRIGYRAEFTRLAKERFDRAKSFHARTDTMLAQTQAALVGRRRPEEAAEVKAKREQLAALWVKPPVSMLPPPTAVAAASATPAPVRPPLGTAMLPPMAKMPPRQVVEKLLTIGAAVSITQRNATTATDVKAMSDVLGDRFTVTKVDFRRDDPNDKPITTEELAIVEALPDVMDLSLRGAAVTDAILEKIKGFRHLDRLTLENAKITAAAYAVLPTLTDLKELHLRGLGSSDEAMKSVGLCRKLDRLTLANLPIGDAGLAALGKLPSLQELDLNDLDKLTSVGLGHLAEIHSLRRLNLGGMRVSSPMIDAVAKCVGLESLSLGGNPLKDDQIVGLSALARLHTLNLSGTGIVGTAFAKWPTRTAMTTLNLTNQPGVDDAALKAIGAAFPKLETLEISGVPLGATAEGFASVGRLRSLRTLRIGGGVVNDEIMAEIAKCNDLQSLSIPGGRLTEPGAAAIGKMGKLTTLDLGTPPVSDAALKSLARAKALKSIQIAADAPADVETKLKGALNGVAIRK